MTTRSRTAVAVLLAFVLGRVLASATVTRIPASRTQLKEATMSHHASGTFDVKVLPQTANEIETAAALGRYTIDKQFHGGIDGSSKGEMLSAGNELNGSAIYVALERVTASLDGRSGSFVLQHSGFRNATSQDLRITVVPESGTGQLAGITGKFTLRIEDKKHFYDFEYSLTTDN